MRADIRELKRMLEMGALPRGIQTAALLIPLTSTEPDAAQWIPPGTSVTIQGITIPEGMVYVGRRLTAVKGSGNEPALIDPGLKIINRSNKPLPPYGPNYQPGYLLADYSRLSAELRGYFLQWMASGRSTPQIPPVFLQLFLYGVERRLLASSEPPSPAEQERLCRELTVLTDRYIGYLYQEYQRDVSELLDFLELRSLLADGGAGIPDPDKIARLPKQYFGTPTLLEIALSRLATLKEPLNAAYAWAWLVHDPEYNFRTPLRRCPEEGRDLFLIRYAERFPKGIKLTLRKTAVTYSYRPASHSFSKLLYPTQTKQGWLATSRSQIGKLRLLAENCADELDAYSRSILKQGENASRLLSGAALLPEPLFQRHDAVSAFQQALKKRGAENSETAPVTLLPTLFLRKAWNGSGSPLTRTDAVHLLEFLDRSGWIAEPDLRYNGVGLHALGDNATIALLPRHEGAIPSPVQSSVPIAFAALPLLVSLADRTPDMVRRLAALLPALPQAGEAIPERLLARLVFLCANPDELKLPRKDMFIAISPEERHLIADALVAAAGMNLTPAKTKELLKFFRLIGAEEAELYPRLHTAQTMPTISGSDGFVTVQEFQIRSGFAIPAPSNHPTPHRRTPDASRGGSPRLDHAIIRQKQRETERVSAVLSAIFTEEMSPVIPAAPPNETPAPIAENRQVTPLKATPADLLQGISEKPTWDAAAFAAYARAKGWLPNAAREAINDLSFEICGEALLSGEDPIEVMTDLLPEIWEGLA